jgi:hypothetical protein
MLFTEFKQNRKLGQSEKKTVCMNKTPSHEQSLLWHSVFYMERSRLCFLGDAHSWQQRGSALWTSRISMLIKWMPIPDLPCPVPSCLPGDTHRCSCKGSRLTYACTRAQPCPVYSLITLLSSSSFSRSLSQLCCSLLPQPVLSGPPPRLTFTFLYL